MSQCFITMPCSLAHPDLLQCEQAASQSCHTDKSHPGCYAFLLWWIGSSNYESNKSLHQSRCFLSGKYSEQWEKKPIHLLQLHNALHPWNKHSRLTLNYLILVYFYYTNFKTIKLHVLIYLCMCVCAHAHSYVCDMVQVWWSEDSLENWFSL